jgi:hypothetical protein
LDLSARLVAFYEKHAPHKVQNIGNLLSGIEWGKLTVTELDGLLTDEYGEGFMTAPAPTPAPAPAPAPTPALAPTPATAIAIATATATATTPMATTMMMSDIGPQAIIEAEVKQHQQQQQAEPAPGNADAVVDDESLPLPAGWAMLIDDDSGDPYYVHLPTRKTVWDRPNATTNVIAVGSTNIDIAASAPKVTTAKADAQVAPLPAGWKEYIDKDSGDPYFVNTNSGEAAWDRPTIS